uniref:phage tail tape measure protein n=1 Tax=Sphingomonas sp. TaxID=28214 RepID=UPI003B3A0C19
MGDERSLRIRMRLEAMDKFSRPFRDLAASSGKVRKEYEKAKSAKLELDAATAKLGAYWQLDRQMWSLRNDLAKARAKAAELRSEMRAAENPSRKLAKSYGEAERQAHRLTERIQAQARQLTTARAALKESGVSTANLAQQEKLLAQQLAAANEQYSERERRLKAATSRSARLAAGREAFDTINNRATGLAAGGMSAIATARTVAAPVLSADEGARQFQSRMTDIAQKAEMTRTRAAAFGQEIVNAARAANQLPSSMQSGLDALMGLGVEDPAKALAMMKPIGKAATAYKADIADLSNAAFAVSDNLGVSAEQTGRVIDIMSAAGKRGAFEIKDMAASFPELTASMQALKSQGTPAVADLAAALQITRKGAGDSSSAANNLQNLLAKINTKDTIDNFKKFGVDVPAAMKKAAAEGRSPIEEIVELTRKATGGDTSKLAFLFGDMQVQQALRPLLANTKLYREIRAQALAAQGVTEADFVDRMKDAEEQARRLAVAQEAFKIGAGAGVTDPLAGARGMAAGAFDKITAWAQANPGTAGAIGKTALAFALLFATLGGGAIAIAGMLAPFAALKAVCAWMGTTPGAMLLRFGKALLIPLRIFPLFARGIWFMATGIARAGALMLANPMVLAIAGLVALLAFAAFKVWQHWDKIKLGFTAARAYLGGLAGSFAAIGGQIIRGLVNGLLSGLGWIRNTMFAIGGKIVGWFKDKLGIHSPSRVFMGLGEYLTQGLERGIALGEEGPIGRMDRLSRRVTAAIGVGAAVAGTPVAAPAARPAPAAAAQLPPIES